MFQQSDSITEITKALLKFQALAIKILKEDQGQIGRSPYNYANLETVYDAIRPALDECKLVITQWPGEITVHPSREIEGQDEKGNPFKEKNFVRILPLMSKLAHESGEWMSGVSSFPIYDQPGINSAQAAGGVTSYQRRYALLAILGIPMTDDDAQQAGPAHEERRPMQQGGGAKNVIAPTTKPWQELFEHKPGEKGEWGEFEFENTADKMKTLKWPQMRDAVNVNSKNGGINPALTAANAHYLEVLVKDRGCASVVEALDLVKWDGPPFLKMNAAQLRSAFDLIVRNVKDGVKVVTP